MILTPAFLVKRRGIILADLLAKVEAEDWHGVQDCASDIREIEAQLKVLESQAGLLLTRISTHDQTVSG